MDNPTIGKLPNQIAKSPIYQKRKWRHQLRKSNEDKFHIYNIWKLYENQLSRLQEPPYTKILKKIGEKIHLVLDLQFGPAIIFFTCFK